MRFDPTQPPEGSLRDWVDYRADTSPDRPAYLFTNGDAALSWGELRQNAGRIAANLTSLGIAKGKSVAIMMPNSHDAVCAFFGIVYGGFRATVLNLAAGNEAIGYALRHSGASYAFVGPEQVTQFDQVNENAERLDISQAAPDIPLHSVTQNDAALLMYTSGTTGTPKGVIHRQSSLLAGGWTTALAHQLTEEDRGFCVLPMYHINGLCVTVISTLITGASLVMAPKFSTTQFWAQADTYGVTWFSVVPTIISHLLHSEIEPTAATLKTLRFGRSASSALAPDVHRNFERRFGIPLIETMGLTETAAQILSNPLPPGDPKIGSPGIAFGNRVRILDSSLRPLPAGESGEIVVSGPNVMAEYLNNAQANAQAFTAEGWLRTGDLGHMDEDGYVFVTGRLKELIIKGGENIAPREIDEALYSNTDVIEAAAFSEPCKTYGEKVMAAVKVDSTSALTEQQLLKICTDKLGTFKCPERIFFLDELPKGPSGKIQRGKISDLVSG